MRGATLTTRYDSRETRVAVGNLFSQELKDHSRGI